MKSQKNNITLLQHRKNLLSNPNRYEHDKENAIANFAKISYKYYGSYGQQKQNIIKLLKQLGKIAFAAQGGVPIYEYSDALPRAWNSPMRNGWDVNYIVWEIGHLKSRNQGGLDNPENLSFQSARGNQHIQTSMNYWETTEWNVKEEIKNRIANLFMVHTSAQWKEIIMKIEQFPKSKQVDS